MIRLFLRMALIVALTSASSRSTVRAQPAPSTDQRLLAKQYVDAGIAAQKSGNYDAAIDWYQKAYKLVTHPSVLFDIAQAYRLSGRVQLALQFYRRYLAAAPDGDAAPTARTHIADLEATLGATRTGSRAVGAAPVNGPGPAQRAVLDAPGATDDPAAGATHELGAPTSQPALPPPEAGVIATREAPSGSPLRITGLAVAGIGVAALAVGTGFALHARTLSNRLQPGQPWSQTTWDDGRRADKIAITAFISGGVLLGTGAVLYWRGRAQDHGSKEVVVAPAVSDHGAGLVLLGNWP